MSPHPDAFIDEARQHRAQGRLREALTAYQHAADVARAADDIPPLVHALRHVADLQRELGDHAASEQAAAEAVGLCRHAERAAALDLPNALRLLALAHESLGRPHEAAQSWREARPLYAAAAVQPGVDECDQHLARLGLNDGV